MLRSKVAGPRMCRYRVRSVIALSFLFCAAAVPPPALAETAEAAPDHAHMDHTQHQDSADQADPTGHDGHAADEPLEDLHGHHHHAVVAEGYRRTEADYRLPDPTLTDQSGKQATLAALLDTTRPVMLNFIYTSCTAICPAMSGIFAQVQNALGEERLRVRLISVSIDPEYDTPERLAAYAGRFDAGPEWRFVTGSLEDSIAVQQAFDAYRGDKMNHTPLTLLRAAPGAPWVRYDGFAPADVLTGELRAMLAAQPTAREPNVTGVDDDDEEADAETDETVYNAAFAFGSRLAELRDNGADVALDNVLRGILDALAAPQGDDTAGAEPAAEPAATAAARVPVRSLGFTGDDYATLNAQREGVVVLPSGVQYEVLTEGTGRQPGPTDSVVVRYVGRLVNGNVFDTTFEDGEAQDPAAAAAEPDDDDSMVLKIDELTVPGLKEALLLMTEGARWRVVIPPGRGFAGTGTKMLRNRDLIYEIELLRVAGDAASAAGGSAAASP